MDEEIAHQSSNAGLGCDVAVIAWRAGLSALAVRRGFVDIDDGQIHFRTAGVGSRRPLVMIHASPASSKALEPLLRAMAGDRRVVAPDTLGNGDSVGTIPDGAEIPFFAAAALEALTRMGLDAFDLYGTHTGGSIAAEIAIAAPDRVGRLILDGLGLYPPELQRELLERYAPQMAPDHQGMYLAWTWHFVRDTYLFWPWYRLDQQHRRPLGLPPARVLHEKVVEVLKAIETYHHSYRAAFRYDKRARLALLRVPTLAACSRDDMLARWHDEFATLIPGAELALTDGTATPEALASTAGRFRAFLDRA
jgi:pimeloyl-ACP methyl ester carboxylesterase